MALFEIVERYRIDAEKQQYFHLSQTLRGEILLDDSIGVVSATEDIVQQMLAKSPEEQEAAGWEPYIDKWKAEGLLP